MERVWYHCIKKTLINTLGNAPLPCLCLSGFKVLNLSWTFSGCGHNSWSRLLQIRLECEAAQSGTTPKLPIAGKTWATSIFSNSIWISIRVFRPPWWTKLPEGPRNLPSDELLRNSGQSDIIRPSENQRYFIRNLIISCKFTALMYWVFMLISG